MAAPRLLVGLGNPGKEYEKSRHNIGFRCLDAFAQALGLAWERRGKNARYAQGEVAGSPLALVKPGVSWLGPDPFRLVLMKPLTYMNLSGPPVADYVRRHKIPLDSLLVVYDDVDLPLGKLRLRERGSAGGHKGMESLIAALGASDFPRLRVGIAPAAVEGSETLRRAGFVLGRFSRAEEAAVAEACQRAAAALACALAEGMAAAMNRYN